MSQEQSVGIKESLELVKGVEILGVKGAEILKGGIGADDIPKALELLKEANTLIEAVKGLGEIPEELKDLSQEELIQLGLAVFGAVKNISAAVKAE